MVLISMTKDKYITLSHIIREVVWIKRFVNKLGLNKMTVASIALHEKNEIRIALTKNAKSQHQTK